LKPAAGIDLALLHARLSDLGVGTVLHRARNGGETRLSFLISAAHSAADIDAGIGAIRAAWGRTRQSAPRAQMLVAIAEQSLRRDRAPVAPGRLAI